MATPQEVDSASVANAQETIEPSSTDADLTPTTSETPDENETGEKIEGAPANRPRFPTHGMEETRVIEKTGTNGNTEITEEDCYEELGFCFPSWKKWWILSVIFIVQVSMNFNTSLYSNAIGGIGEEFGVSDQAARAGAAIFLITYAFGCELWAPWSEELGRKPIIQASLFLVNIFQLPVALAPNFATVLVGRALGGLSTAGGSVTLGMIADMYEADKQQHAVAFIVFSSVGGSVLGPVVGGFVEQYCAWRWNIWIQLIFGVAVQILHLFTVPETRTTVMMNKIAKKRRKNGGDPNVYGPTELVPIRERFSAREILVTWIRPFKMFLTEPIVLTLSLLSGFSDALIFMFVQSYGLVYKQWNFNTYEIGLAFIPLIIGYFIAWASFIPVINRNIKERKEKPDDEKAQYESRLWWLLYTAPCLPIGLIIFGWTATGPPLHWMGTAVGAAIVGIANYSIYMATIDYMICAYGPYSASATGGNGWSRDFLAGVLTIPATPFFQNIGGKNHFPYAFTILFCISFLLVAAVYVIYYKGPVLRKRSPFAQQLSHAREEMETGGHRLAKMPTGARTHSFARSSQNVRIRQTLGSRQNSYASNKWHPNANSNPTSAVNSARNSRRNSVVAEEV
ncbi:hypothetical protein V494_00949 [Pseudogymnoascus sp. VKM F-4513 (FW-928)]|nr:hypothetical protein V494_00949 [Pseudogymnoascus sp. VKM F-4513 (FW-928)]